MSEKIDVMDCDITNLVFEGSIAECVHGTKVKGDQFIQRLSEILAEHYDKEQKL
ncbi:hypothetical protein ACE38V_06535 [Cytobacillus sp. Hz8]|uniref:hypothetical protein n=1 Tax=Cytobacillus sp. Hz8 TaxID=3347168 RepID=UPI0035DA4D8F